MDVNEVEETLMNPSQRIIKQISINDAKAADNMFENLMGNGVTMRKIYIKEHSQEAVYNAE